MTNYKNIMTRMRKYVMDASEEFHKYNAEIEGIDPYNGSAFYEESSKIIFEKHFEAMKDLKTGVIKDVSKVLDKMRSRALELASAPPTADMINILSVLSDLSMITPAQFGIYAQRMADSPLALMKLQQIAEEHDIAMNITPIEAYVEAIDLLEHSLSVFIRCFDGDISNPRSGAYSYCRFFMPDNWYKDTDIKSADKPDKYFWENEISSVVSPEVFEETGTLEKIPEITYHFDTVNSLVDYINKSCENSRDPDKTVEDILSFCPETYRDAYSIFKQTGEIKAI